MTRFLKQKIWHDLFEAGILFKAINSVWEILGGIFLLTRFHTWIGHLVIFLSNSELLGDHDDFIFHAVNTQLQHLDVVSTRTFVGLYLLFHGILNAFLAYNLYRNRLWAYPTMIGFILLFFVYQIYRLMHTHSPVLLAVSVLDVLFIVLTWHEYQFQKRRQVLDQPK